MSVHAYFDSNHNKISLDFLGFEINQFKKDFQSILIPKAFFKFSMESQLQRKKFTGL